MTWETMSHVCSYNIPLNQSSSNFVFFLKFSIVPSVIVQANPYTLKIRFVSWKCRIYYGRIVSCCALRFYNNELWQFFCCCLNPIYALRCAWSIYTNHFREKSSELVRIFFLSYTKFIFVLMHIRSINAPHIVYSISFHCIFNYKGSTIRTITPRHFVDTLTKHLEIDTLTNWAW